MIRKLLFRVAKLPLMGRLVGFACQRCIWAIPAAKVYRTRDVLAFRHPRPSYANHLIITPRRPIASLQQMASNDLCGYLAHLLDAAQAIATATPIYHGGFVLVANGGPKQEVHQVHFHLFTGRRFVEEPAEASSQQVLFQNEGVRVIDHSTPRQSLHWVLQPTQPSFSAMRPEDRLAYCRSILQSIDRLDAAFGIVQKGYSLVWQSGQAERGSLRPECHILSGFTRA